MSCYWDLYCWTCEDGAGLHVNHGEKSLQELLRAVPVLSEAAKTGAKFRVSSDGDYGWFRSEAGTEITSEWLLKHAGHDVDLRNEYGNRQEECYERVDCSCCGGWFFCQLPRGHDGQHSSKKGAK